MSEVADLEARNILEALDNLEAIDMRRVKRRAEQVESKYFHLSNPNRRLHAQKEMGSVPMGPMPSDPAPAVWTFPEGREIQNGEVLADAMKVRAWIRKEYGERVEGEDAYVIHTARHPGCHPVPE